MNTSLNKNLINTISEFAQIGYTADQVSNAFIDLCNTVNAYLQEENSSMGEIRGGKGNKKMGLVQPSTSTEIENPKLKDDLEIFNANFNDDECIYIIPTAQEKPMKLVFKNDEFIWKGEVNPLDIN